MKVAIALTCFVTSVFGLSVDTRQVAANPAVTSPNVTLQFSNKASQQAGYFDDPVVADGNSYPVRDSAGIRNHMSTTVNLVAGSGTCTLVDTTGGHASVTVTNAIPFKQLAGGTAVNLQMWSVSCRR